MNDYKFIAYDLFIFGRWLYGNFCFYRTICAVNFNRKDLKQAIGDEFVAKFLGSINKEDWEAILKNRKLHPENTFENSNVNQAFYVNLNDRFAELDPIRTKFINTVKEKAEEAEKARLAKVNKKDKIILPNAKIVIAKRIDNIRSGPTTYNKVVRKTSAKERLAYTSKVGEWYKLVTVGTSEEWVHESVVDILVKRSREVPKVVDPPVPSYSVELDKTNAPYKRTVTIRLPKKYTKAQLRAIATEVKKKESAKVERTFITHYLPGMEVGAGAWASTHYNPTLAIKIYGADGAVKAKVPVKPPSKDKQIVCDKFVIIHEFDGSTLNFSIDTDLPDYVLIMVSVDRVYVAIGTESYNRGERETYSHAYFDKRSTVKDWRKNHSISIDNRSWNSSLQEHIRDIKSKSIGSDVVSVENEFSISFVVPVNQPDPRFGKGNKNLVGKMVEEDILRVVRVETEITNPIIYPYN